MMMVPAVWQDNPELPAELRDFYAYHSCLMEPWDGPAAIAFTDGTRSARRSTATGCGRAAGC